MFGIENVMQWPIIYRQLLDNINCTSLVNKSISKLKLVSEIKANIRSSLLYFNSFPHSQHLPAAKTTAESVLIVQHKSSKPSLNFDAQYGKYK